ncbi:MAG: CBS domain-containing protein [Bacteroidia bacterium]
MIAEELISDQIIPLKRGDLCEAAISFMHDAQVVEMPVVEHSKLLGYLHISTAEKTQSKTVGQAMESKLLFIPANTHLFDIARIMYDTNATTIAVCDEQQNYIGSVALADLLKAYSKNTANSLPGAIVTLEMFPRDYSLTEIARITESNDFKITGLFIRTLENNKLEISLKFNSVEIKTVLHTLERYNYNIKSIHQLSEVADNLNQRLDWLIKYINT